MNALLAPALGVFFFACGAGNGPEVPGSEQAMDASTSTVAARSRLDVFDVTNNTCALYVAVRSVAWQRPFAFGIDLDAGDVHWNMCPGGTMVACAAAPNAAGDTTRAGIPWPYPPPGSH